MDDQSAGRTLHAVLVGVDRYASPGVPGLAGCVNDVDAVLTMLGRTAAAGTTVDATVLRDAEATRAGIAGALRSLAGRAGPRDVVLFWFAGHGSLNAGAPTLVCHDSRIEGVPDLGVADVSALLGAVAGHVTAVLDAGHAEGPEPAADSRWRAVPPGEPGPAGPAASEVDGHLTLAACRLSGPAEERLLGGVPHGLFTWSLLRTLHRAGPAATCRQVLAATRAEVARRQTYPQVPRLRPAASGPADRRFLDGAAGAGGSGLQMWWGLDGWQINAGHADGLPADAAGLRFGVPGTALEAGVSLVLADRALVTPLHGWQPPPEQQFPVVLTALPRPVVTVAGPVPGGPSPWARRAAPGEAAALRIKTTTEGVRITGRQGPGVEVPAGRVPGALAHLARWHGLLGLANPGSGLGRPIRLEVVPAASGERVARPDSEPMRPGPDGAYRVEYVRTALGWAAPEVFLRLRNTSGRDLYVTLLDLTPQYGAGAQLFPVAPIAAGRAAAALQGRRIRVRLPAGEPVEPGRTTRDRLLLIVAEEPFSADAYVLPPLTARTTRDARRELVPPVVTGADWTVQRFELVTVVPAADRLTRPPVAADR